MKDIKLEKVYRSENANQQPEIECDHNHAKRPSWVKISLDKAIMFIKILCDDEAFWYRRYFEDYFFPLDNSSEDYKNYYNAIAQNYEAYVPQNKEMIAVVLGFLKEFNISHGSSLLDFGAGTGLVTAGIAKSGYTNITLIDIAREALAIAREKRDLKNAKFIELDIAREEIPGIYDVVFETMSLDYFKGEQMLAIFQRIRSALKDGGIFIMIDRHRYPELKKFFKEIKSGKIKLSTPEGVFDYYYFIGEKVA